MGCVHSGEAEGPRRRGHRRRAKSRANTESRDDASHASNFLPHDDIADGTDFADIAGAGADKRELPGRAAARHDGDFTPPNRRHGLTEYNAVHRPDGSTSPVSGTTAVPAHNPLAAPPAVAGAERQPPSGVELMEGDRASTDAPVPSSEEVVSRFLSSGTLSLSSRRDSECFEPDRFSIDSRSLSVLCNRRVATTSVRITSTDLRIPDPPGMMDAPVRSMDWSASAADELRSVPGQSVAPAATARKKKFLSGSSAFGAGASTSSSATASKGAKCSTRNPLAGHQQGAESPDTPPPPDAVPIEELVYNAAPEQVASWFDEAALIPAAKLAAFRRHREIESWLDGVGFAAADAPANSPTLQAQTGSVPGVLTRLTARNIGSHLRILNRVRKGSRGAHTMNTGVAGNSSSPRAGSNASIFESPRTSSTVSISQQRKQSKPASVSRQLAATLRRDSMSDSQHAAVDLSDTLGDDDYADGDDGDGGLLADVHELADDASSGAGAVEGAPSRGTLCSERDGVRSVISSSAVSPSPFGSPWVPASPGLQSQSRRSALNRW